MKIENVCTMLKAKGFESIVQDIARDGEPSVPCIVITNVSKSNGIAFPIDFDENMYTDKDICNCIVSDLQEYIKKGEFSLSPKTVFLNRLRILMKPMDCKVEKCIERTIGNMPDIKAMLILVEGDSENVKTYFVNDDVLNEYGITKAEAWASAVSNEMDIATIGRFNPITKRMEDITDDDPEGYLFYLTNKNHTFGATAILNAEIIDDFLQVIGKTEAILIPSSIHEWILLTPDIINQDIVEEVNRNITEVNKEVNPEEVLCDHAFIHHLGDRYDLY